MGQTRKVRGGVRTMHKKSASSSKTPKKHAMSAKTYRLMATATSFKEKVKRRKMEKLFDEYAAAKNASAENTTIKSVMRASVKLANAQITNLLILYRKLLIIKIYYKNTPYFNNESKSVIIGEIDDLKSLVLRSLKYVFRTAPISIETMKEYDIELKNIFEKFDIPPFKEILTELAPAPANTQMHFKEEIAHDNLDDDLLAAFSSLQLDTEEDDAFAALFANMKVNRD
jgi:hypothetical protein